MPRYRQKFTIYPRKLNSGKTVYYYRTYDEFGRRTTPKSTGQTSKTAANAFCQKLLEEGNLLPTKSNLFGNYASDWWIWDSCPYIKRKLVRSSEKKPGIAKGTAIRNREILDRHITPYFSRTPIDGISPDTLEQWMFSLKDKKLANKTINNIRGVMQIMLKEAYRRGIIHVNPMDRVEPFSVDKFARDLLTLEEATILLEEKNWSNPLYYVCNCLAAATGMRLGEIRGITSETWHGTHVDVRYSYTDRGGLGPTKTKERRLVPVPSRVAEMVENLRCETGFILSHDIGETPISGNRATVAFNNALHKIGISNDERKARGLTFHGWRHWFNTMMRSAGVPDAKIMGVTGHKTEAMLDHYTDFRREDFVEIETVQNQIWNQ